MRDPEQPTDGPHLIIEFSAALPPMVYEASTDALHAVALEATAGAPFAAPLPPAALAPAKLKWTLAVLQDECGHRIRRFDSVEQAVQYLSVQSDPDSALALALVRQRYRLAA